MSEVISYLNAKCVDMEGGKAKHLLMKNFNIEECEIDKIYRRWRENLIENFDFRQLNKNVFKAKNVTQFAEYYEKINVKKVNAKQVKKIYSLWNSRKVSTTEIAKTLGLEREVVRTVLARMKSHGLINDERRARSYGSKK